MSQVKMEVKEIPLEVIHADDSFNCRGPIAPIDVVDLVKDIEVNGLIQPVVICPYPEDKIKETGKHFRLIAGYRRYTSFKVLERDTIPCVVRSDMMDDVNARFFNFAENLKRRNLTTLQEARALEKLKDLGVTEHETAERIGKSRSWVQIRYNLLALPQDIQIQVGLGVIKQTQIRDLYSIYNEAGRDAVMEAAKKIKEGRVKGVAVDVNKNRKKPRAKMHRKRAEIFELMEHIQETIGNGIWTRCLAWCAGEITNSELYQSLEDYAKENNLPYIKPDMPNETQKMYG